MEAYGFPRDGGLLPRSGVATVGCGQGTGVNSQGERSEAIGRSYESRSGKRSQSGLKNHLVGLSEVTLRKMGDVGEKRTFGNDESVFAHSIYSGTLSSASP